MSFAARRAKLCTILRIDLPGHDVRLSEGGEVRYAGDVYSDIDPVLGTVIGYEDFSSGDADHSPAFELVWGPKDTAAAVALAHPSSQGAFAEWRWLSIDRDTNAVLADHRAFTGLVDNVEITLDEARLELRMGFATHIDRLLNTDKGNRLNRAFHRSVWPGETGLDFMTGTVVRPPWGEEDRKRGGATVGGGGGPGNTRVRFR